MTARGVARTIARAVALAMVLGGALPARAAEFLSVAVPAAVMYDAPSTASTKLFLAPPGMPVEVVAQLARWVKVRDMEGALAWVERSDLAARRTVIARGPFATVRSAPDDAAPVLFRADRGVLMELIEPAPATGWAKVRYRDGTEGFVRAIEVWGL